MASASDVVSSLISAPASDGHDRQTGRTGQHSLMSRDAPSGPTDESRRPDPSVLRSVESGPLMTDLSTEHLLQVLDAGRKEDEPR